MRMRSTLRGIFGARQPMCLRPLLAGLLALASLPWTHAAARAGELPVESGERLLVIAPHPDDETIGAGGLIQRVVAKGGSVRVVLLTAGDGYVEAVQQEAGTQRPDPARYVAYGQQ